MGNERRSKIRRILLTLFYLGLILAGVGFLAARLAKKEILKDRCNDLDAISNLQVAEIRRWISAHSFDGLFLQQHPDFQKKIFALVQNQNDPGTRSEMGKWMRPFLLNPDYCSVQIYDSSKVMIVSYSIINHVINENNCVAHYNINIPEADSIFPGPIYYSKCLKHYHFDMYVPVFSDNTRIATLALTINTEHLLSSIILWPVHSKTTETILFELKNDSIIFINQPRFGESDSLNWKLSAGEKYMLPNLKPVSGIRGFYTGTDYRHEAVLLKISEVAGTEWHLITKVDLDEVFFQYWNVVVYTAIMFLIFLFAVGAVLTTIWKRNEANLLKRELEYEQVKKGLEKHYEYLTRYANDIIMLMNENGDLLQINERGLEKYEYSQEEIKSMNVKQLRSPGKRGELPQHLQKVKEEGHIRLESIHISKSGVEFPVEVSARKIQTQDGVFIQSIVRDITNRKKYEQAIVESENNLRITLESIGDAVIVTNRQGCITRINKVAQELTGWNSQDALQQPLDHVLNIRMQLGPPAESIVDKVIRENKIMVFSEFTEIVSKSGQVLQISDSAAPIRNAQGDIIGVVVVFRDVTEKNRREQVLRESEEKFRLLAEASPVAIMIYQDDRWKYANRSAETITGYKVAELLNMNFWEIVYPDDRLVVIERGKARQQGREAITRYQFRIINKQGSVRWVDLSGSVIMYQGKTAGMVSVMDITDQKSAMLTIAENESRLKGIFKAAPIGIGIAINRVLVEVNERVSSMTGYPVNELTGRNARMLYPSDEEFDYVGIEKYRQIETSGVGEVETHWKTKSGAILDIMLRSVPLDANDLSKGIMFTALDITARKKSEASIRENQRMLATLMSNLPGIVYRCRNDLSWSMIFLSEGFTTITGYPHEDFLEGGKSKYSDLIHPDDRDLVWETVQKAISSRLPYELEFRLKTKNSGYHWVWEKGRAIFNDSGHLQFLEGFISDINERKRNEEIQKVVFNIANAVNYTNSVIEFSSLIRTELSKIIDTGNFLLALYDASNNTISLPFMADKKDHFETFPAGKTLTGYMIANNKPLLADEQQIRQLCEDGLIEYHGTPAKAWLGVPLKNKDQIIGALVVQNYESTDAYSHNDLEIMQFVSNQVAISIERKRNEDELIVAKEKAEESDRLKTAFLANMSHEIRTPMNAIIGFSDLMGDPFLNTTDRKNYLNIIQNNGQVLLNLIDDIIDTAKLEAGQLKIDRQPTKVNEIMDELFNHFSEFRSKMSKSHIELRYPNYHGNELELSTDALRFRQIISNLVSNALKFTERGFVELGYLQGLPESAPEDAPENAVTFYVKDSGIGIPKDKLALVFERFGQAYDSHAHLFGGTGLGLTISKNLTNLLGGIIWVESNPGDGSVFYVALPGISCQKTGISSGQQLTASPEAFDGSSMHVLVAEDDSTSAFFLKKLIEKTGARVSLASNGEEAVRICEGKEKTDLVFMDLRMPVMNGFEATRIIRNNFPNLPVIAQTAFAMHDINTQSALSDFDDVITKPIKAEDIISALRKYSVKV